MDFAPVDIETVQEEKLKKKDKKMKNNQINSEEQDLEIMRRIQEEQKKNKDKEDENNIKKLQKELNKLE